MIGISLNTKFHNSKSWLAIPTWYLIDSLLSTGQFIPIESQEEYDSLHRQLDGVLLLTPGWGSPRIQPKPNHNHKVVQIVSDPHHDYWKAHPWDDIDIALTYYYWPTRRHLPMISEHKVRHFPWFMPNAHIGFNKENVTSKLHIFGATNHAAYETRNWCRSFPFVVNDPTSGCEGKKYDFHTYYQWLSTRGAVIAAGSLHEDFQLVTPKYFEIAGAGSLLFAQRCRDLYRLGFNNTNCVLFDKSDFEAKAKQYMENPSRMVDIAKAGNSLIRDRHTLAHRVETILEVFCGS